MLSIRQCCDKLMALALLTLHFLAASAPGSPESVFAREWPKLSPDVAE